MVWKKAVSNTATCGVSGMKLLACSDARDRSLVVKRSEFCQLFDLCDNVIIDEGRAIEVFATMHDTMPDRNDRQAMR